MATMATVDALKAEANNYFNRHEFREAVSLYTKALDSATEETTGRHFLFGNRSISYLKLEMFGSALEDANQAINLDKNYIKGYYRRAAASMALGRFRDALRDFEAVVKVIPQDRDARNKLSECHKIVQRDAFYKAINVEKATKKSPFDSLTYDTITVENDYSGPRIPDTGITPDFVRSLVEHFKHGRLLHKKFCYRILIEINQFFKEQPTLVDIDLGTDDKFTICGDIHGQFFDLINIFQMNGFPSQENPYLFNGDFVDRGSFSVEVIFVMFSYKLLYKDHFYMARGNHESMTMNQMYGFEGEVKSKYNHQMYDLFAEVFNLLPLAHCINRKVFIAHGGLFSHDEVTLEDIKKTDRARQPPDEGIMCELLWSDPMSQPGRAPSKRGVGIQFGPDVTRKFLTLNNLEYVIRSHEVKQSGYESAHDGKCITVFSAPNYCDTMGNLGSFITIRGGDLRPQFTTFSEVPHPDVKPMAYASSLFSFMS